MRFLAGIVFLMFGVMPGNANDEISEQALAQAGIIIKEARIAAGELRISGASTERGKEIMWRGKPTGQKVRNNGRFVIGLQEFPATCSGELETGSLRATLLIANCGLQGPVGATGPIGADGPAGPKGADFPYPLVVQVNGGPIAFHTCPGDFSLVVFRCGDGGFAGHGGKGIRGASCGSEQGNYSGMCMRNSVWQ